MTGDATVAPTRLFVREVARTIAVAPVSGRLVDSLADRVVSGDISRADAVRRLMDTPQSRAALIQGRYHSLLDREPTSSELRRLTAGLRAGRDLPWVTYQIARSAEYLRTRGAGNDAGFIRAATSDLLDREARADEISDLDGQAGRDRWLRERLNGGEYRRGEIESQRMRLARGPLGKQEMDRYLRAYRGQGGYSRALARILASSAGYQATITRANYIRANGEPLAAPPPVVHMPPQPPKPVVPPRPRTVAAAPPPTRDAPTLDENAGLSVKRVPGFLAGYAQHNLASPYNQAIVPGRSIDATTVDYWTVTLNLADSVSLKIVPTDANPASDYLIRIWGPDDAPIGSTSDGDLEFSAPAAGTYTLGISLASDAGYPFEPTGGQPTPSGPSLHAYAAEFNTFPGPNTNIVDILQNYSNPSYTDNHWPAWVGGQAAAYNVLTRIAAGGVNLDPKLRNFLDFRVFNDTTDPVVISNWLTEAWEPFEMLLGGASIPDSYNFVYGYSTLEEWVPVATAFLNDPATQADFLFVNRLIENANVDRQAISDFLKGLADFAELAQINIDGNATEAADLLSQGLTSLVLSQGTKTDSFWDDLIDIVGGLIEGVAGVIDPALGIVADGVVSGIVPIIQNYVDGPSAPAPVTSDPDLYPAAASIDAAAKDAFTRAFELLSDQAFITSIFSDYGRLEALGNVQFEYSSGNNPLPTGGSLRRGFDTSAYKQLVPVLFKWVSLTGTSLSGFAGFSGGMNLFPDSYSATFQYVKGEPIVNYSVWEDECSGIICTGVFNYDNGGQSLQNATEMAMALQNGQTYGVAGLDFTPVVNPTIGQQFGPGPFTSISGGVAQGRAQRFYTTSLPGSEILVVVSRTISVGDAIFLGNWGATHSATGTYVQEWALLTPKQEEIGADAAAAIFGAIPPGGLTLAQGDVQRNGDGLYVDFAIPDGGLVTRFDAFTTWGLDVPGFAFPSISPYDREFYFVPMTVPTTSYNFDPLAEAVVFTVHATS